MAKTKESKSDKLSQIARKYLEETSIHGLKYIYEKNERPAEKVFWILAVSGGLIMAIVLCYQVSNHRVLGIQAKSAGVGFFRDLVDQSST